MLARRVVAFGWSPDSQQLAYFSSGAPALSVLQLSTGEERIVREFSDLPAFGSASDVRWSPDGARLAVSLGVFDSRDLFLMWSDGSSLTRLTNGGINDAPRWSPDGNRLVYSHSIVEPLPTAGVITSTTSMHNLYALNVRDAFSNPAALTPVQLTTSGQDFNPQWQP
jgi:Tol biopolymer transport system component